MEIKEYNKVDETLLFDMLMAEGDEWSDYYSSEGSKRYIMALASSIVYVAYDNNILCGYVRCRGDNGFGVYIYDLLVEKSYRGNQIGRSLMERVCQDHSNQTVYVMSDVDAYYEKLGYKKAGSIFLVKRREQI